ncbi:ribonuclease P protein subunit p14-like [Littorina saxatilis]|uniref:Uncharacterized protein n=1 Tax=Littorina saxatilis TaxID=31220 RepID=A0AAN9BBE4_9CAEN
MTGDSEKHSYLRQVDKSPAPYFYIKTSLEYEGRGLETDSLQLKHVIMQSMTEVFGQVGASDTVDVLKLSASGEALLRVPSRSFVKLWGALTLFGKYNGLPCVFRVQQVSSSLMSLSCNSRTWDIPAMS